MCGSKHTDSLFFFIFMFYANVKFENSEKVTLQEFYVTVWTYTVL